MKSMVFLLLLLGPQVIQATAQDSVKVQATLPVPVTPAAWYGTQKAAPLHYNYYQSLGLACKAELKLEQATHVPFRFRLGSLAQTDYMEQKPHAVKPERP